MWKSALLKRDPDNLRRGERSLGQTLAGPNVSIDLHDDDPHSDDIQPRHSAYQPHMASWFPGLLR